MSSCVVVYSNKKDQRLLTSDCLQYKYNSPIRYNYLDFFRTLGVKEMNKLKKKTKIKTIKTNMIVNTV